MGLCSRGWAIESSVDRVLENKRLKMGSCSRGWTIECSLDGIVVNKRLKMGRESEDKKWRLISRHFLVIHFLCLG